MPSSGQTPLSLSGRGEVHGSSSAPDASSTHAQQLLVGTGGSGEGVACACARGDWELPAACACRASNGGTLLANRACPPQRAISCVLISAWDPSQPFHSQHAQRTHGPSVGTSASPVLASILESTQQSAALKRAGSSRDASARPHKTGRFGASDSSHFASELSVARAAPPKAAGL